MEATLVIPYIESRRRQLKAAGYDLSHVHLTLKAGQSQQLAAQGQLYVLVSADPNVYLSSDTGRYYIKSPELQAQMHEHTGNLTVQNNGQTPQNVVFAVATWQY